MNDTQSVSIRLERGESVKWHDGEGWHVGTVLTQDKTPVWIDVAVTVVQTCDGIYAVPYGKLEPHPPRCERCGGTGKIIEHCQEYNHVWDNELKCPECGGSGRKNRE